MPLPLRKFNRPTPLITSHDHNTIPLQVLHQISGWSPTKDDTVQNTGTSSSADVISTSEIAPVVVPAAKVARLTGMINPRILMSAYNVDTYTVQQSGVTNAVFGSIDQGFGPADLASFQNHFNIPLNPISTVIGAHNSGSYLIYIPTKTKLLYGRY